MSDFPIAHASKTVADVVAVIGTSSPFFEPIAEAARLYLFGLGEDEAGFGDVAVLDIFNQLSPSQQSVVVLAFDTTSADVAAARRARRRRR